MIYCYFCEYVISIIYKIVNKNIKLYGYIYFSKIK